MKQSKIGGNTDVMLRSEEEFPRDLLRLRPIDSGEAIEQILQ